MALEAKDILLLQEMPKIRKSKKQGSLPGGSKEDYVTRGWGLNWRSPPHHTHGFGRLSGGGDPCIHVS